MAIWYYKKVSDSPPIVQLYNDAVMLNDKLAGVVQLITFWIHIPNVRWASWKFMLNSGS